MRPPQPVLAGGGARARPFSRNRFRRQRLDPRGEELEPLSGGRAWFGGVDGEGEPGVGGQRHGLEVEGGLAHGRVTEALGAGPVETDVVGGPAGAEVLAARAQLGDEVGGVDAGELLVAGAPRVEDVAGAAGGDRQVVAQQGDPGGGVGRDGGDGAVVLAREGAGEAARGGFAGPAGGRAMSALQATGDTGRGSGMSKGRKIAWWVFGVWVAGIVFFAAVYGLSAQKAPDVASGVFTPIDEFKLDTCNPGYRWLELTSDGELRTGIKRVAGKTYQLDFAGIGY